MTERKKLFSKSNQDCCSVEIEEVDADDNCHHETTANTEKS